MVATILELLPSLSDCKIALIVRLHDFRNIKT